MYRRPEINCAPEEVLVYLRKSRTDDPLLSVEEVLARHEEILDTWAEKHLGGKVPEKNKLREIVSGETIADRPEMVRLLRMIESPKIQAVLIVEVQRLSRGDLEDAGRLIKLLRYTNTLVITKQHIQQPERIYDLRDEYDRDAFERELKRGNEFLEYQKKIQQRGRLLSVSQGNFLGNQAPYGYRKIQVMEGKKKCHTLEIVPEKAEVVRMIFDMYVNQDMGRVSIARYLNENCIKPPRAALWAQDTIKDMLENEHYLGKVRWNWRKTISIVEDGEVRKTRPKTEIGEYLVFEGKHEAIVDEEIFQAAREKQGRNTRKKATTKVRNPLAGLVFCRCGRAMSLRTYKKDGKERSAPRLLCDNQAYCGTSSVLYEEILERVCQILRDCIEDFEIRIANDTGDAAALHQSLIKRLEARMEEIRKKEVSQWEAQTDPDPANRMPPEIFRQLNAKLLQEKDEVQAALCKAYEAMPEPVDYEERMQRFQDALDALQDAEVDAATKNRLLKACIDRIDYTREKAQRVKSQQKRVKINGERRWVSPLSTGATWTAPPFELDVKLRL